MGRPCLSVYWHDSTQRAIRGVAKMPFGGLRAGLCPRNLYTGSRDHQVSMVLLLLCYYYMLELFLSAIERVDGSDLYCISQWFPKWEVLASVPLRGGESRKVETRSLGKGLVADLPCTVLASGMCGEPSLPLQGPPSLRMHLKCDHSQPTSSL